MGDRKPSPTLDEITARLNAARNEKLETDADSASNRGGASGIGMAFRISVELVTAVGVGIGIGWLVDGWLGTRPWFMVVMLFLGAAAGVLNVYRVVRGLDASVGLGQAILNKKTCVK